MKAISLKEVIKAGLRKEVGTPTSEPQIVECQNYRVGLQGLEPISFPTILDPQPGDSPPFPQLILGQEMSFLAREDSLQIIDPFDWTLTPAGVLDWESRLADSIVAGGQWHYADLGSNFVMTNGNTLVFKQAVEVSHNYDTIWSTAARSIRTLCHHRGRVVYGGFDVNDDQHLYTGKGSHWLAWSSIGGGDIFAHVVAGVFDVDIDAMLSTPGGEDVLLRNEAGALPLPQACTIHAVKPMGNRVIVYTDRSIYALVLAAAPMPTYGLQELVKVGVYSRESVGGDEQQQFFIDTSGELWTITAEQVQRLGYKEFFNPWILNGDWITISLDAQLRDLYVSGEAGCYILSPYGLSYMDHPIFSLAYTDGGKVATGGSAGPLQGIVKLRTSSSNFGTGLRKTVRGVDVDISSAVVHELTLMGDYGGFPFSASEDVENGWAPVQRSGVELALTLQSAEYADTYLSDIRLYFDERITVL